MNSIPFWTLLIAAACAVAGVAVGLFLAACSVCAELQHRRDEEHDQP